MTIRPFAHLSDDRLVEVCLERTPTTAEQTHLTSCDRCSARQSRLALMFREIADAARTEADTAFPAERLAAQQARILQRIDQDGRPARVIAFPASPTGGFRPLRTRPAGRWIAAAAAAGLAVGLLAGHLAHDLPTAGRPARAAAVRPAPQPPAEMRTASAIVNEEEFLGEIESAILGPQLAVLRPLHDLTPQ